MQIIPQTIHELIPQQPPFVMVDQLVFSDETTSRSTFIIQPDNCMVSDDAFTEGGLMENIAQTAAARSGYQAQAENKPVQSGYIGAVKNLEVYFLPKVGEQLTTEIKIENQFFNVSVISGSVWCNNELAARCEMKVFLNEEV